MESNHVYQFYKDQGISVFPVSVKRNELGKTDKKPSVNWSDFQKRLPTEVEIEFWTNKLKSNGYGLVTGELSRIAVVDVDTPDLSKLDIFLPETLSSRTVSGGTHFYYQQPQGLRNSTKDDSGIPFIDTRAEGGFVVIPPTEGYKWITDGEFDRSKIAPFPTDLLQRLSLAKKSVDWNDFLQTVWSEGSRNNASAKLIGYLIANKYRSNPPQSWDEVKSWNQNKCLPPILEDNLKKTFDSILASETEKRKSQSNNTPIYSSDFSDFPTFANPYQIVSASDLVLNYKKNSNKWIVENLIPENGITFIAGNPKSGKSLIGLHIALSIIHGTKAFGAFNTQQMKVLYIPKEDSQSIVAERLLHQTSLNNFHFCYQGNFSIDTPHGQEQLIALENEIKPDVIIFDSYRRFISGNENDSEVTNKSHSLFKSLLNKGVKSIIVIHHINKPRENFSNPQMLRGSSDLWAMLDSLIFIEKKNEIIKLTHESSRVSKTVEPFCIQFTFPPLNFSFLSQDKKVPNKKELVISYIEEMLKEKPMSQIEIITKIKKTHHVGETTIKNAIKNMSLSKQGNKYLLPR